MFKTAKVLYTKHQRVQFVHDEQERCVSQREKNSEDNRETFQKSLQIRQHKSNRKIHNSTQDAEQHNNSQRSDKSSAKNGQ